MNLTPAIDINSQLYSIAQPRGDSSPKATPVGVFLSVVASKQRGSGADTKLPENVKDLTALYETQSRHMYDTLSRVEYEQRYLLPESFKDQVDREEQYFSLKNRMTEIYRNKPIQKLLTIKLSPDIEFEQLQALEKAFYSYFERHKGNIDVTGTGEKLTPKILDVVKLAAEHYCESVANRQVSFELRNFSLTDHEETVLNKINGFGL